MYSLEAPQLLHQNILWVIMEAPHQGTSKEYPHVFHGELDEIIPELSLITPKLDWLPCNWYMNQHKNSVYFTKILSYGMPFSLIWLISLRSPALVAQLDADPTPVGSATFFLGDLIMK